MPSGIRLRRLLFWPDFCHRPRSLSSRKRRFTMRSLVIFIAPVTLLAVVCLGTAQEKAAQKPGTKSSAKAPAAQSAAPVKAPSDEEAIRQAAATYVKAYSQGDAKAVAAHFT